ncbi:MAG TPA: wax ester/triacylglycerol synthase family O-acyltransferase [Thermoleophilaceae bacterium]|jgi:WS/DGAT/MGAT family acyltransferase
MSMRLGSLDAAFLELEDAQEAAHMHLGAALVFEARAGGPPTLADLRAELQERIEALPRYRSRLTATHVSPLRRPSWEPDPGFAISRHVRRAALPAPGGEGELMDWLGDFWSVRLDRTRPLWDVVLLEGLEGGRWALATKTHHALVDGVASVGATQLLLDGSRGGSRRRANAGPPRAVSLDGDARGLAERLGGLVRGSAELVSHPLRLVGEAKAAAELILREELVPAPASSLNVAIGPQRRYAVGRARLRDLKAVKNALGGTVNDVILAAAAGGLRRLMEARGEELPERGLRAMVPVSTRAADDDGALGNRVSSLFVHLPVCEPDPVRRYLVTAGETAQLKAAGQARSGAELLAVAGLAPPLLHSVLTRASTGARLFNITVTNVPGPPRPLYAFGSRMEEVLPLVPLAADHSIGIAVVSYAGSVCFGISGDASAATDLEVLCDGIEESIRELRTGARREAASATRAS